MSETPEVVVPVQAPKRVKPKSRAARWAAAVDNARKALDVAQAHAAEIETAMSDLRDMRDEFQGWLDSMPDGPKSGPTGEKLEAILAIDLDVEVDFGSVETAIEEAEGAEVPLGFGRD